MIRYQKSGKFTEPKAVLEKRLSQLRPDDVQALAREFFTTATCKDLGIKAR